MNGILILQVDSSQCGIGAALMQDDRVIEFALKSVSDLTIRRPD